MRALTYIAHSALVFGVDLLCCAAWAAQGDFCPTRPGIGPQRPLIFIPGTMGSKLCAADGSVLWSARDAQSVQTTLKSIDDLRLPPGGDNGDVVPCGVIDAPEIYAALDVEVLYQPLFTHLSELGYVWSARTSEEMLSGEIAVEAPAPAAFAFDYDWRLSNLENARRLNNFIARVAPTGEYDIVAHSMGGVIARIFLVREEEAARLKTLVLMGTPHRGAAKTLAVAYAGWTDIVEFRRTAVTLPSFYELLPRYPGCCHVSVNRGAVGGKAAPAGVFNPLDAEMWVGFPALPPDQQDRERLYDGDIHRMLAGAADIATTLDRSLRRHDDTFLLVSSVIDTTKSVTLNHSRSLWLNEELGQGDGAVTAVSASNFHDRTAIPLESASGHATIFADAVARANLCHALIDRESPPKSVPRQIIVDSKDVAAVARRRSPAAGKRLDALIARFGAFKVDVELKSFGFAGFERSWAAGQPVSIDLTLQYVPRIDFDRASGAQGGPLVAAEIATPLTEMVRERFIDRFCAESEGINACLDVGAVKERRSEGPIERIVIGFSGRAPDAPGMYAFRLAERVFGGFFYETLVVTTGD